MNLTPKGLKKPSPTDAYDIEIQNSNMDMIDELIDDKVDKVEGKGLSANDYTLEEKIKLGGISKQATKVEASGINGNIKIDGLQAKVYDDSEISNRVGPLANLLTTIKTSIVNAINSIKGEVDEHKAETANKHIKESGSNVNGSYIKFDDGTQICRIDTLIGYGAQEGALDSIEWVYPVSFIAAPTVVCSSLSSEAVVFYEQINTTLPTKTIVVVDLLGKYRPNYFYARAIAIGRWK